MQLEIMGSCTHEIFLSIITEARYYTRKTNYNLPWMFALSYP